MQPVSSLLSTKALEELSLAIDEKIFFLSGNSKETNIIKIMNNPDSLQRNLLTLISINIIKKVFFYKLKKIDAGTAAPNSSWKETKDYHKTLSAWM